MSDNGNQITVFVIAFMVCVSLVLICLGGCIVHNYFSFEAAKVGLERGISQVLPEPFSGFVPVDGEDEE